MSEDRTMGAPNVETVRSLIGQIGAVMADIEAGKERWRASALANERCPVCPGPTFVGASWVGELRPGVGIVERLLCGCAAGHEWWAAVPQEDKK